VAEAAELYGLPLEEFTAERDRRVKALRAEGEREAAAAVAALRKPTLAAWAVNQLARSRCADVDALLEAGSELLEAQRGGEGAEELQARQAAQRTAVAGLVSAARSDLGRRATEQTMQLVAETLRAASITQEGRALLRDGCLTGPITTTGWEILAADPPASRPATARAGRKTSVDDRARARLEKELRAAEKERSDADSDVRRLERAAETARSKAEQAELEARQARERADAAEADVERIAGELDGLASD